MAPLGVVSKGGADFAAVFGRLVSRGVRTSERFEGAWEDSCARATERKPVVVAGFFLVVTTDLLETGFGFSDAA